MGSKMSRRMEVLFPEELSERLARIAEQEGCSVASLVREAVQERYGLRSVAERLAAVEEIAALEGPDADWEQMEDEIVAGATSRR